ncbi:MAG: type II toxin-antitoxin system RelE/ParE family toxin [Bacteroidales bacterium]|jgi:plasmid stabilization system protein ParE|nr:type II toxin-antitoxin system RelE/ParE family toxin [Bacteroidales bacterium]NLM92119.1 type II toxin-antitoxin system RelE/ParE family toxin [Bacteroidales bacterium]
MRKVVFSRRASIRLEELLQFLEREWSEKAKKDFIKKLDRSIHQITKHPDSTPESESVKGLHRCVVTKQTTLFYRYDSKTIQVAALFDTRQHPDKLKKEL